MDRRRIAKLAAGQLELPGTEPPKQERLRWYARRTCGLRFTFALPDSLCAACEERER